MFSNVGGLISTQSFLTWDSPESKTGNGLNLATSSNTLTLMILLLLCMNVDALPPSIVQSQV